MSEGSPDIGLLDAAESIAYVADVLARPGVLQRLVGDLIPEGPKIEVLVTAQGVAVSWETDGLCVAFGWEDRP